jgi:hypothetical protein
VAEEALLAATAALAPGRPLGEIEAAIKDIAYPDGRHINSAHFTSYRADGSESLDLPPHVIAGQVLVLDVNGVYTGYQGNRIIIWALRGINAGRRATVTYR